MGANKSTLSISSELEVCKFEVTYDLHSKLLQYYREGKYCDIILKTKKDGKSKAAKPFALSALPSHSIHTLGKSIPVHSIILAAASNYMDTLFSSPLSKKGNNREIQIGDVTGDILLSLVNYCYTGQIDIEEDNIDEMIAAATMLQFDQIQSECFKYYSENLRASNCLSIWNLAKQYDFESLKMWAISFACNNFMRVIKTDEYLQLSNEQIMQFLSNDEINVPSEEDVFRAIVIWIKHDINIRKCMFPSLIDILKISEIDSTFLGTKVHSFCKEIDCLDVFEKLCASKIRGDQISARKNTNKFGLAVAVGMPEWENVTIIRRFCPKLNEWEIMHKIPKKRQDARIFFMNKHVIFQGENQIEIFNLKTGKMNQYRSTITAKRDYSAVAFVESIYFIGGNADGILKTVQRYSELTNKLTNVASMSVERSSAAAVVLSGSIYVIGGQNAKNGKNALCSAECYNPFLNKWTSIASMSEAKFKIEAAAANGFIYVIGQKVCDRERLDSIKIERYDRKNDAWTMMSFSIPRPENILGMSIVKDGAVLAVGKYANKEHIHKFEIINFKTSEVVTHVGNITPELCIVKLDLDSFADLFSNTENENSEK